MAWRKARAGTAGMISSLLELERYLSGLKNSGKSLALSDEIAPEGISAARTSAALICPA
jgi:hypothetical protein